MPGVATGLSLRLPSFLSSSAPHLCIQWSSSLHLTRKPDGFEAPPVFIPWRSKIAYKFIVDGRWMTNDAEPTEVDHGFVNNVYTAPAKPVLPEPEPSAPPSYHSETEVEPEPAEKVADEPTTNGTALLPVIHETPATPPVEEAGPEQQTRGPDNESEAIVAPAVEAVRKTVAHVVEAAKAVVAQVVPAPIEVEKAADEVRFFQLLVLGCGLTTTIPQITSVPEAAPKDLSAPVAPEVCVRVIISRCANNPTRIAAHPDSGPRVSAQSAHWHTSQLDAW